MSTGLQIAVAAALLSPLAGIVGTLALRGALSPQRQGWPALVACSGSLLSGVWLALQVFSPNWIPSQPASLVRWIRPTDILPLDVTLSIYIDELTALLLLLVPFLAMMIVLFETSRPARASAWAYFAALLGAVFAVVALLVSAQLLVVLFFWQLISVAVFVLAALDGTSAPAAISARRLFLVHFAADLVLAAAVLVIWNTFDTFDFSAAILRSGEFTAVLRENPEVLVTISVCVFLAVLIRAAQFPLLAWVDDLAPLSVTTATLVQTVATMPAAVYLMLRCAALVQVSPYAQVLMAFVATLTVVIASIIAATGTSVRQVLAYGAAARYGLCLLGIGTGLAAGVSAAVFALITHMLAKTSLTLLSDDANHLNGQRAGDSPRPTKSAATAAFLIGSLVLIVDAFGTATILTACHLASTGTAAARSTLFGEPPGSLYALLYWAALLATSLLAFALFRALFRGYRARATARAEMSAGAAIAIGLPLAAAIFAAPALNASRLISRYLSYAYVGPAEDIAEMGFTIQILGGLSLAAFVMAWLLFGRRRTPRLVRLTAPLVRLGQHRFYLPDLFFFAAVLPVRAFAQLGRFVDWLVMAGLVETLPRKIPSLIARLASALQTGQLQFYALSVAIAALVLLVVFSNFMG